MEGGNGLQHFPSLTFTPPESGKRLVASPSGRRVWFADEVPEGLFPEGLPLACDAPPQHPPSPPYEGPARPLKPAIVVRPLLPPPRRSWYQRFRDAAYADHTHELHALCYAIHDPRAARAHKLIPYLVLNYALSPLDLIPDFIPILGLLDNLILLPALLWLAMQSFRKAVIAQARYKAELEPLRLSPNWVMATVIFTGQMLGVEYAVHWALQRWAAPEVKAYAWHVLAALALFAAAGFLGWMLATRSSEAAAAQIFPSSRRKSGSGSGAPADDKERQASLAETGQTSEVSFVGGLCPARPSSGGSGRAAGPAHRDLEVERGAGEGFGPGLDAREGGGGVRAAGSRMAAGDGGGLREPLLGGEGARLAGPSGGAEALT